MATAVAMRPFYLAVVVLGLASLLLATGDCTAASTTELRASVLPHDTTLTGAGQPASSHHHRASSTSTPTALPDAHAPRGLDVSAVAREDATAPATTATAAAPASTSPPCVCVRVREDAVEDILPAPGGITATATMKALLHTLPLLAVPFLPTPLAALVALSAMSTPVRAGHRSNETCPRLPRATCTVYRYLPDGTVDRDQPLHGLSKVCDARSDARSVACCQRRGELYEDPLHRSCHVRTLELYDKTEGFGMRVLPGHLPPVADPDAAVASGADVCYVELEQGNHRVGYYILCPVRKCPRLPYLCCSEFSHHAVVAAA